MHHQMKKFRKREEWHKAALRVGVLVVRLAEFDVSFTSLDEMRIV